MPSSNTFGLGSSGDLKNFQGQDIAGACGQLVVQEAVPA